MFGHPALRTSCIRAPRFGIGAPRFGRFCRTNIGHGNFTPLFCDLMVHFHLPAVAESLNYGFSVREVFHGIAALQPTFPNAKIRAALVPYLMYQRPTHTLLGLSWNCLCSCAIRGFTCLVPKWYSYEWKRAFADTIQRRSVPWLSFSRTALAGLDYHFFKKHFFRPAARGLGSESWRHIPILS